MKLPCFFSAVLCILLGSCSTPGEPSVASAATETSTTPVKEAAGGFAPRSLAGASLSYTDLHSRNVYRFSADGKFTFEYVHVSGTDSGEREGRYQYKVTGPNTAVVDCGETEVITLRFDSATTAIGTIEGDARKYVFKLSRPAGG